MLNYSFQNYLIRKRTISDGCFYYRKLQEEAFVEQESKTELEQQCLQIRSHLTAQNHKLGTISSFQFYMLISWHVYLSAKETESALLNNFITKRRARVPARTGKPGKMEKSFSSQGEI